MQDVKLEGRAKVFADIVEREVIKAVAAERARVEKVAKAMIDESMIEVENPPKSKVANLAKRTGTVFAIGIATAVTTVAILHTWDAVESGWNPLGFGGKAEAVADTKQIGKGGTVDSPKTDYREELLTSEQRNAARDVAQGRSASVLPMSSVVSTTIAATSSSDSKPASARAAQVREEAPAQVLKRGEKPAPEQAKVSTHGANKGSHAGSKQAQQQAAKASDKQEPLAWDGWAKIAPDTAAKPVWETAYIDKGAGTLAERIKQNKSDKGTYGYKPTSTEGRSLESEYKRLGEAKFCRDHAKEASWFCSGAESAEVHMYDRATVVAGR
ncbi:MAG: hypothetical protein PHE17_19485 [Thiothrix sp.]|uniref:hypothetical protein n=1 Tax=Thiothrix sp. TaxID=1032 RepID=UPI0026238450|nr:hypothetical protein [Thiothrix sp.]MDD5395211.1 hypothetical protein [Thiothrix sp.]